MPATEDLYQIADELRSIADLGLSYTENTYDEERYRRVLSASARIVTALEGRPQDEILSIFMDNLSHVSPNAGSSAAVFRDGRILLIKREDNGLWAMPGGLVDVGETLAEAAARELEEEANVFGKVTQLLGIWDSRFDGGSSKAQMYHAVFLVEAESGEPVAGPETTDAGFFSEEELPALAPGHIIVVPIVFGQVKGQIPVPYFDSPEDTRHKHWRALL